jgi:hypothetical protein
MLDDLAQGHWIPAIDLARAWSILPTHAPSTEEVDWTPGPFTHLDGVDILRARCLLRC